jgi:hypothetical protein
MKDIRTFTDPQHVLNARVVEAKHLTSEINKVMRARLKKGSTWAAAGTASHIVEQLENLAALLGVEGYQAR